MKKFNLKVYMAGQKHLVQREAVSTAEAIRSVYDQFQNTIAMPIVVSGGPAK